jgi:hypothetical protein
LSIILNEKEWAENVIANRTLGAKPVETLSRVARFYHQEQGYKKTDVRSMVERFLLQCSPGSSLSRWSDRLDIVSKTSDKYKLIKIDSVDITQEELRLIKSLDSRQPCRLAFTLLCVAKFMDMSRANNNGWINTSDKEIMKMANINTSIRRQSRMFHDLRECELVRFSKRVDNLNIQVVFMKPESKTAIHITDFRNLGFQYNLYYGESYIQCDQCGVTVRKNSNSHKYCQECATEIYLKKSVDIIMRH